MDRGKQRIFLAIFAANFISTFGESIPQPFQPLFLAGLGISAAVIGLFYNVKNVIQTVIRIPVGALSDRVGRKRLMLLGLLLLSLVPFIYSFSNNPFLPLLGMILSGFGVSLYYPPSEAYASSLFPQEKVGQAMGRFHLGWAISAVIGPFVGGLLTSVFPDYRSIFQIASAVTFASVLVIFLYAEEDSNNDGLDVSYEVGRVLRDFPSTMGRLLRNGRVVVASIAVFSHSFCNWMIPAFFPLFATGIGFDTVLIGVSLTLNALMMGVALPYMGSLSDRVGRLKPIILGMALTVLGFGLLPILRSVWAVPILMALIGLGAALVFPVSQAVVLEAIPLSERGAGTGLWGTVMSLGGTVGLFVMSFIASVASLDWIFYFSAIFTMASAVPLLMLREYFKD